MSRLNIIPVYEDQARYAQLSQAVADDERPALYQQTVIAPHWSIIAEGGEFIYLAQQAARPIMDVEKLAEAVDLLAKTDLTEVLNQAFDQTSRLLPVPHTTVALMAGDPTNAFVREQMYGIAGYAPGAGKVWLQIDPLAAGWQDWLSAVFTHEYHHSAWITHHYTPFDLGTYLIFEGRAEVFVQTTYPDRIAPWTHPLPADDEARLWVEMQPHLRSSDWGVMSRYIFGNRDGVPQWAGYRLGFKIVRHFLQRHPTLSVAEWTGWDAHDLIAASGYPD